MSARPSHQLSTFPVLAARLCTCNGDRIRCGMLEVVLDLSLPPDAILIPGPIIERSPVFELLDRMDGQ